MPRRLGPGERRLPEEVTPLHVGIVGCSAEGAALCYRTLCAEGAALLGPHAHPEVSLHTPSLARYAACLERGDLAGVADLMLDSATRLARCGAQFLICPDNTIHQALPLLRERSPLPWLHIAEVVAAEAVARGHRRLGLLGTRWLVESDVYPVALAARGLACVKPDAPAREQVHRIIMDELVPHGSAAPASTAALLAAVQALQSQGCDAVVLGCTELPLALGDANSALPTLDSTRLLARAALRHAVGGVAG
jgi:aspartate racemase